MDPGLLWGTCRAYRSLAKIGDIGGGGGTSDTVLRDTLRERCGCESGSEVVHGAVCGVGSESHVLLRAGYFWYSGVTEGGVIDCDSLPKPLFLSDLDRKSVV